MVSEGFTAAGEEGGGDPTTAAMVRFPRRNQNMDYHRQSLKLETVDESAENTSLWQVPHLHIMLSIYLRLFIL